MERQVSQMVRLVDDLLDLSRITQGKIPIRKERVDIITTVQDAVESIRPSIDSQAHTLELTLPPQSVYVDADQARLAQVFANLLNNASKYTEKGGRIQLTVAVDGNEVVVSIRDTGIGISSKHLPHVFDMFAQAAPALERSQGGLGIGLALVKGMVALHGGSVSARSEGPGKGSEFTVRLPIARVAEACAPEPLPNARLLDRPSRRILVVDDNRDGALTLSAVLNLLGHTTCMAHDGVEAIETATAFLPEVVLLDIGLPKINGYDVARHIRAQPWGKDIALVAVTGWGQEDDKRRASDAGFDMHLTKPVEASTLAQLIARPHQPAIPAQ
jgi:CheY-like chemotaxis protein/two-component sensor histidine kinase